MDAQHFDCLARSLTALGTRRGLLAVLAALPVVGGLLAVMDPAEAEGKGRRKRRKKRHKHGKGRHKHKKHTKKCKPKSKTTTCAGKCGPVKNNCQKTVDCGSCACDPPCGECFICNETTQVCEPDQQGECCTNADCSNPTAPICDASRTCVACSEHSDCGADTLCLSDGSCQDCTVTCSGTPAECGTALQTALDDGGTVYVCPGNYQGGFILEAAVSVIGAGEGDDAASNTILDGSDAARVVQIDAGTGTVELAQVRLTGGDAGEDEFGSAEDGGGVQHQGTTLRMRDCTVTGNIAGSGGGIQSDPGTTLELTRCTLSDNTSVGGGGAISTAATTTLTDCLYRRQRRAVRGWHRQRWPDHAGRQHRGAGQYGHPRGRRDPRRRRHADDRRVLPRDREQGRWRRWHLLERRHGDAARGRSLPDRGRQLS